MCKRERVGADSELLIPMEVSAGVAASAATRLSMSQPPSSSLSASNRKEWRAISEHRNAGDEVLVSLKLLCGIGACLGSEKMWGKETETEVEI